MNVLTVRVMLPPRDVSVYPCKGIYMCARRLWLWGGVVCLFTNVDSKFVSDVDIITLLHHYKKFPITLDMFWSGCTHPETSSSTAVMCNATTHIVVCYCATECTSSVLEADVSKGRDVLTSKTWIRTNLTYVDTCGIHFSPYWENS